MGEHNRPTSEWEHSHAAEEGDKFVFFEGEPHEEHWQITSMDDKMVHVRRLDDGRVSADERDAWPHESLNEQLAQGEAKRERDGLSHELASF